MQGFHACDSDADNDTIMAYCQTAACIIEDKHIFINVPQQHLHRHYCDLKAVYVFVLFPGGSDNISTGAFHLMMI